MASVRDAIDGYIRLRDKRDEIKRRHKEELKPLSEKMQMVEGYLLNELNKAESDSISVKDIGTAYKSVRTSAKVNAWDETLPFILDNGLTHMLERRVSKAALDEYIEANGESLPGVSISREITVNIRRN